MQDPFSPGTQNTEKGWKSTMLFVLACSLILMVLIFSGCNQKGSDDGNDRKKNVSLELSAEDKEELTAQSKELLSSPEVKVESVKLLDITKLDSYEIPEPTLGTLKSGIEDVKKAGFSDIVVAQATRSDGEKVYAVWRRDADGKWQP